MTVYLELFMEDLILPTNDNTSYLSLEQQKYELRRGMQELIKSTANKLRENWEQDIVNYMISNSILTSAQNIAIYRSCDDEVSLDKLIDFYLNKGCNIYQPVALKSSRQMFLQPYELANPNIFINEISLLKHNYQWYNLDLIYIPLIAIDKHGYRLGRGGGYYDVLLADLIKSNSSPVFCGVGYTMQLVDKLPIAHHDIPLDYFLSNSGLIKFKHI